MSRACDTTRSRPRASAPSSPSHASPPGSAADGGGGATGSRGPSSSRGTATGPGGRGDDDALQMEKQRLRSARRKQHLVDRLPLLMNPRINPRRVPEKMPYFLHNHRYRATKVLEECIISDEGLKHSSFLSQFDPRFVDEILKCKNCIRAKVVVVEV